LKKYLGVAAKKAAFLKDIKKDLQKK